MTSQQHWIIRVSDGDNFRNSKHPFWGLKSRNKSIIDKRFKKGDILWFLTSKKYGGKLIGVAEYTHYYDRDDEPLLLINTYSNEEQNWRGQDNWSIQVHYENLYITEKQDIKAVIRCASTILDYETFKDRNLPDLYFHYSNFKYYAEPKKF
tara:strand:- start:253 stop:705 length:453 start_codon:yes stop_codon:yes gene_type:complete